MKKNHLIYLCAIICILNSCIRKNNSWISEDVIAEFNIDDAPVYRIQHESTELVDINDVFGTDCLDIDNLVDTMYFVPLQTTPNNVFYYIERLIVTDDRVFLMDRNGRVLIFDSNGKFINQLKRGQGPGEINYNDDISYDENSKKLVVVQTDMLLFYDKDGNYIESKVCPILTWEFTATEWGYLFFAAKFINYDLGEGAKYAALSTDKNGKVIGKGIGFRQSDDLVTSFPYLYILNKRAIITEPGNDTVFEAGSSYIRAKYIFEYSKYKADVNSQEEIMNSSKYYHSAGFMENNKTQFIHFHSGKKGGYTVIRDKDTKKAMGAKHFMCSPEKVPMYCINIRAVYNDYFVSFMNPYNNMHFNSPLISETDNKKIANLTEEDNAVLIFFKMKEIK